MEGIRAAQALPFRPGKGADFSVNVRPFAGSPSSFPVQAFNWPDVTRTAASLALMLSSINRTPQTKNTEILKAERRRDRPAWPEL